jgi:hypothetical protein
MPSNVNANAFIPQIWDASVLRTLEDNLVAKKICNTAPTGKVKGFGDTVYFNGLAEPTVAAYGGSLTYEALVSSQVALLVNQQNSYAFKVTDVEASMANVDLKGSQADRAAYQLKKVCDDYIMQLYTDAAAGTVTDTTCDTATILGDIGLAKQYLAENNVMENDMWMVIPPWVQLKLELAGIKFSINEGINGKGGMSWCKVLGFDLFVTNQVYATGGVSYPMAGSYRAIAFADKLMKSEAIRLEQSFDWGVRGLHVFGAKVVHPKELVQLALTPATETAI